MPQDPDTSHIKNIITQAPCRVTAHKARGDITLVHRIIITNEAGPINGGLDVADINKIFDRDARDIVDALIAGLPGGTIDRILVRLMTRDLSSFIVRHRSIPEQIKFLEKLQEDIDKQHH